MKKRKFHNSYYWIPDPKLLWKAKKKGNLEKGFKVLTSLWKRGITFKNLEASYFFTWYAYGCGNVSVMAKAAGIHRNTAIYGFRHFLGIRKTFKIRPQWKRVMDRKIPFSEKVKLLYDRAGMKPRISKSENRGLVNLWLMGMPGKVVRSHNVLYLLRKGVDLVSIGKHFEISSRGIHRYRAYAARAGSPVQKWLVPLKPTREEWFKTWYKSIGKNDLSGAARSTPPNLS